MGFSYTILSKTPLEHRYLVIATFSNSAGSIGGNIDTRLSRIDAAWIQHIGSAVVSDVPTVNATTFPIDGNAVPIVTKADTSGLFFAIGV